MRLRSKITSPCGSYFRRHLRPTTRILLSRTSGRDRSLPSASSSYVCLSPLYLASTRTDYATDLIVSTRIAATNRIVLTRLCRRSNIAELVIRIAPSSSQIITRIRNTSAPSFPHGCFQNSQALLSPFRIVLFRSFWEFLVTSRMHRHARHLFSVAAFSGRQHAQRLGPFN